MSAVSQAQSQNSSEMLYRFLCLPQSVGPGSPFCVTQTIRKSCDVGGVLSKALPFVTEIIVCKPHYLGWKRCVVCLRCADLIASYTEDLCFYSL